MKNLHIINPYNKEDYFLVRDFDIKLFNEMVSNIEGKNEKEYFDSLNNGIIIKEYFASIKENKIKDFIVSEESRDTKKVNLYPYTNDSNFLSKVSDYLMMQDMEEIYVFIKKNDNKKSNLLQSNFIPLGDKDDYLVFMQEKVLEMGSMMNGDYKKH